MNLTTETIMVPGQQHWLLQTNKKKVINFVLSVISVYKTAVSV
jgi:hypothetical protein